MFGILTISLVRIKRSSSHYEAIKINNSYMVIHIAFTAVIAGTVIIFMILYPIIDNDLFIEELAFFLFEIINLLILFVMYKTTRLRVSTKPGEERGVN